MSHRSLFVVLVLAAVGITTLSAIGLATGEDTSVPEQDNQQDLAGLPNATSGEQLTGVIGVGEAELEANIEQRAFGIQIAAAANDEEKARIIAEQVDEIENQTKDLRDRKAELNDTLDDGEISPGQYRVRITEIAAGSASVDQAASQAQNVATSANISEEVREDLGISTEHIEKLRNNASDLRGGEVAEIAKEIAGPQVGGPVGGPPEEIPGPPDDEGPGQGEGPEQGQGSEPPIEQNPDQKQPHRS